MTTSVEKVLSANDTGETGGHQAGLLVPKEAGILSFFPHLAPATKNPRCPIDVVDDAGEEWTFNYIYYNNRLWGGTRNEYRLTGMTEFFRRHLLKAGDAVVFSQTERQAYRIAHRRKERSRNDPESGRKILHLSGNWVVIETDLFV
jgi:hypothetical protein